VYDRLERGNAEGEGRSKRLLPHCDEPRMCPEGSLRPSGRSLGAGTVGSTAPVSWLPSTFDQVASLTFSEMA